MKLPLATVTAAALLTLPLSIASAADGKSGIELFRGLYVGMTKDQAEQAFPEKYIDLNERCEVKVKKRFADNRLYRVQLTARWAMSRNDCWEAVTAGLMERYGYSPAFTREDQGTKFAGDRAAWISDGRLITMTKYDTGSLVAGGWMLVYEVLPRGSEKPDKIEGL
ncbi:hypothetical protein K7H13_04950 [Qipengyuania citrea]|uniref:hypothetical protein n=1 Tax=Qipengyuania citrea TaxID=225971 RepID=UPI001E5EF966|nr:hypothetical protein [Qipengyuania citrea]MCD1590109.1 hypothetical protein [Qipengyuania citrea]